MICVLNILQDVPVVDITAQSCHTKISRIYFCLLMSQKMIMKNSAIRCESENAVSTTTHFETESCALWVHEWYASAGNAQYPSWLCGSRQRIQNTVMHLFGFVSPVVVKQLVQLLIHDFCGKTEFDVAEIAFSPIAHCSKVFLAGLSAQPHPKFEVLWYQEYKLHRSLHNYVRVATQQPVHVSESLMLWCSVYHMEFCICCTQCTAVSVDDAQQ